MVTYKVWKESKRGSDTFRTFSSVKQASRYALNLHKKGQLNDVVVSKRGGRERGLNKTEAIKFNKATRLLAGRKMKGGKN